MIGATTIETQAAATTVACQLYRTVLRRALHHPFHVVCIQAISAIDALLRFLPSISMTTSNGSAFVSDDAGPDFVCSSAEDMGFHRMTVRDVILECVHELSAIVACSDIKRATPSVATSNNNNNNSNNKVSIAAAAAKALGALSVQHVHQDTVLATFSLLVSVVHKCDQRREVGLIGRALSSCASLLDGLVDMNRLNNNENTLCNHNNTTYNNINSNNNNNSYFSPSVHSALLLRSAAMRAEIVKAIVFCAEWLPFWTVREHRDSLSAAVRAQVEMSQMTAIHMLAMFLRVHYCLSYCRHHNATVAVLENGSDKTCSHDSPTRTTSSSPSPPSILWTVAEGAHGNNKDIGNNGVCGVGSDAAAEVDLVAAAV